MKYTPYHIISKLEEVENTWIIRVKPADDVTFPEFKPGQYCFIKNPTFSDPKEEHPFSITSPPTNTQYLEFCVKTYGDWSDALVELKIGDTIRISEPQGEFMWDASIKHAVFLLGGIGIAPIMSMLRYINEINEQPQITLLYGNRTPKTIAYQKEIMKLETTMKNLDVIHIFFEIPNTHPWPVLPGGRQGYRGFITAKILQETIDLATDPTFFIVGPPIFIEKMNAALKKLGVEENAIRKELLEKKDVVQ